MRAEEVMQEVAKLCRSFHAKEVILYGSRAKGTAMERSDIDIAVRGGDFDGFYWDIKEQVHSLLSFDVVDLNSASDELKKEIERSGVTIYEKA